MNGSSAQIAVIKARLPYVDRRALSQAWFSALRLAQTEPNAGPSTKRRLALAPSAQRPYHQSAELTSKFAFRMRPISAVAFRHSAPVRSPIALTGSLRRAAEAHPTRALTALRYPPVRASFHLEMDGGRVQIIVRREGCVLHVVALCSEKHVGLVQRALGCAALHLGARGESLRSDVRAVDSNGVA